MSTTLTRVEDGSCLPSSFHLPEVCRQIYSETATLGYALNTFSIGWAVGYEVAWANQLLPAQKNAVASVAPSDVLFFARYIVLRNPRGFLSATFPNLKSIELSRGVLGMLPGALPLLDPSKSWTEKDWSEWLVDRIKTVEAEGVQVIFLDGVDAEEKKAGEDIA
ncbi:hypothetical protein N0V83_004302 [Neocucurbitaria cava]|uniref:Uncharacterized protein n=1 Tax=Neocucurbitaria cava TaxID=798079 RepID=A0A9W8YB31_9PLEO|nr:hypothetical protein N0V83_004302 [Neocucurbitaria cava]